jgi:hypothetical protein
MASTNASKVWTLAVRKAVLTFAKHFSIGFKSGEHGGRNNLRHEWPNGRTNWLQPEVIGRVPNVYPLDGVICELGRIYR